MTRSDTPRHQEYLALIDQVIETGPFSDDWQSLLKVDVPRWYREGKFGIFVHWGVYSVPAHGDASGGHTEHGEWYGRNMYLTGSETHAHHIAQYGPVDQFGYKDFIPHFDAVNFNAEEWARVFRRSGARFVVPVAEHHDGFAMYDSSLTDWNAVARGPKRDVLRELSEAVRNQSMVFGASSHRAENWWFFEGGAMTKSDVLDTGSLGLYGPSNRQELQPTEDFLEDWLVRTAELIDKYRPELLWFDWWIEQPAFKPYLRRLAAFYYNRGVEWGRHVAINYKFDAFAEGTAVLDIERGQTSNTQTRFWQNDTALSKNSWCHIPDNDYKDIDDILGDLVDIVSKNGALLLNVGPKADGTIPIEEVKLLERVGDWLAANGEAIYGTDPWKIYGEGPTEVKDGTFTDTDRSPFTSQDIRFTTARGDIYACLLGGQKIGTVLIRTLGSDSELIETDIECVTLVENGLPLRWSRDEDGLKVFLPDETGPLPVVRVTLEKGQGHRIPPLVDHY